MAHPVVIRHKIGPIKFAPKIVHKDMGYVREPKNAKVKAAEGRMSLPAEFAPSRILDRSGPTLDQDGYPACVGFAFTSNQMRDEKTEHGVYYFSNADALDLYLNCKKIDGYNGDGTYGGAAVRVLEDTGVRASGRWTLLVPGKWSTAVWRAFDTPRYYKISAFKPILNNVDEICAAIDSQRRPVLVGMAVDNQIYDPPATGVLPPPNQQVVGGHELEIFGYNTNLVASDGVNYGLCFALKNSWGGFWGGGSGLAGGRVWMPASWLNTYDPDYYSTTDVRPD